MINCNEIHKSIIKFTENELPPDKESEFMEHIKDCKECTKIYSDIAETYGGLNTKKEVEPKAFFTESVMNKIDIQTEKESFFDITFDIAVSKFFKKFAYTGIAFIIALFVFLYATGNLYLLNNMTEEETSVNDISSLFFENF